MADNPHASVASPPRQCEPSLSLISISPSVSLLSPTSNSNTMSYQSQDCQEGEVARSVDARLKSPIPEGDNEHCNGALHSEDNSEFSKNSEENQNLSSTNPRLGEVCVNASIRSKAKCIEKVNGLTHSDHNSGDNGLLVKLLNNCSTEEDGSENYNHDSGRSSGNVCTDTDCDHVSCDDIGLIEKRSPEVHCDGEHNDVDMLLSKLEKASINQISYSSEHCVASNDVINGITYVVYESEKQMPDIMRLITKDLSEPYSIYTYRYFIHNWPKLCFLAMVDNTCVGAIVCKLDLHKKMVRRGYIAMLAVDSEYRRRQIGSTLVTKAIEAMIRDDCDEVVLETEITNQGALRLYENLGFVRDKRLFRYYLNGVDALRLKLWLR